jgi:hypothetical protein
MSARLGLGVRASVAVLSLVVAGAFAFVGTAVAAAPVYPAVFSGPSAHGRYNVELDTGCQGANPASCQPSPTYLYLVVTTPQKAAGKCPANSQFPFQTPILKKDGSFSATQAYAAGRTMTVSGRFTSPRSAHGTVSGNQGCSLAEFTITLPRPDVPVAPAGSNACYWLDKAHATMTLGGAAKPRGTTQSTYSVITGLGQCGEWTHGLASTYYGARSFSINISQGPPNASVGIPKHLAGLGAGAMNAPSNYGNSVYFRRGSAWVQLYFEVPSKSQPPAKVIAAQGQELITVARRVYALMR